MSTELTRLLYTKIPGTRLTSFVVSHVPEVICAGKESEDGVVEISKFVITIPFTGSTCAPSYSITPLAGIFSWIITDVGMPELVRSRFWLDVSGDLATFGAEGELISRLYRSYIEE